MKGKIKMGLDMYLDKNLYVKNWDHKEDKYKVLLFKNGEEIELENIKYVTQELMYWRKANAIHNWFVKNVQDGEDDCKEYELYRGQLQELHDTCKTVLESIDRSKTKTVKVESGWSAEKGKLYEEVTVYTDDKKAMELLPPTEGFFFGNTFIDDWYIEDLQETVEVLKKELAKDQSVDSYYTYRSSW